MHMRKMTLWKTFFWTIVFCFLMFVVLPISVTGTMLYHYKKKAVDFCANTKKGEGMESIRLRAGDIGFDVIEFETGDRTIVQAQSHLGPFFKNPCVLDVNNGSVTRIHRVENN